MAAPTVIGVPASGLVLPSGPAFDLGYQPVAPLPTPAAKTPTMAPVATPAAAAATPVPTGGRPPVAPAPAAPTSTSVPSAPSAALSPNQSLAAIAASPASLDQLVSRIVQGEGASPPGVLNNPGNIKFVGAPGQADSHVRAADGGTFASYSTPEAGRQSIVDLVHAAALGKIPAYGATPTLASFLTTYQGKASGSGTGAGGAGSNLGLTPEASALYDKANKESQAAVADFKQRLAGIDPQSPNFMKTVREATDRINAASDAMMRAVSEKPRPPVPDIGKLGSAATIIGIIGGLLTKEPMMGALNGAAAAIGAANQGDWDRYKAGMETWKTQSDMLLHIADLQQKHLQDIMQDNNMAMSQKLALADHFLQANQMGPQLDMMEAGQIDKAMALGVQVQANIAKINAENAQLPLISAKTNQANTAAKLAQENLDLLNGGGTEPPAGGSGAGTKDAPVDPNQAPSGVNPAIWTQATNYVMTGKMPALGMGSALLKTAIMMQVPHVLHARGMTPDDMRRQWQTYAAQGKSESAFLSGPRSDTIRSMSVSLDHIQVLDGLIDALGTGNVQALNRLKLAFEKETGRSAPTSFEAAKQIVADEIAKAVIGGRNAEGDRQAMLAHLAQTNSPNQLHAVVQTFEQLMAGQLGGLQRQYATTTGQSASSFDQFLSPRSQQMLKKYHNVEAQPVQSTAPYTVGQIITAPNGKRYRVTGGDMSDPDVEPVQ